MKIFYTLIISVLTGAHLLAQLNATISSTNPTCSSNNGTAVVNVTGGSNYTYKWNNGSTTSSISNLSAGTYTVTVYSAGGVQWDTVYFETFDGTLNWNLNTASGANGADYNYWVVSDAESGMNPGTCSAGNMGNKTLHITSVAQFLPGATYDAGGLCGLLYCPQTSRTAASPPISTVGKTNLVLSFDFMGGGQGLTDNASLHISSNGGVSYNVLDASLKSTNTGCGSSKGRWTKRSYYLSAPYSGISNLLLYFDWVNNDDGVGTDPSIAINNVLLRDSIPLPGDSVVKTVTLTLPLGPDIATNGTVITSPSCGQANGGIAGLSVSGGTSPYSVQWLNGNGGVVGNTYSLTNVPGGLYVFEVTDANQCKDTVQFNLISNGSLPAFNLTASKSIFCPGDSSQLCAPANYSTYQWNNGATTQCIWVKTAGSYNCTVNDPNNCTGVSTPQQITIHNVQSVSISVKGDTLSAFGGVSYQWFFNGNPVIGATNSVLIATTNGSYAVLVVDENGCSNISEPVSVVVSYIEKYGEATIQINPNPFNEYLSIVCNTYKQKNVMVSDSFGRIVASSVIADSNEVNLVTTALSKGVYFVTIDDRVFKLVKQ